MNLWLIGTGNMAREYAKVLTSLGRQFQVVGRRGETAHAFESATGIAALHGGVAQALENMRAPERAIVAVGVTQLASVSMKLLEAGTRELLIEKPGGLNREEIRALQNAAVRRNAKVLIAYNRRHYASTMLARKMIADDGGATSCCFEFTEWAHVIEPLPAEPEIKAAWLLANSSHVIDLAFHLCGWPLEWKAWHGGSLSWHPSAARYCGAGITDRGAYFNYHADWEAPGRWGVEVLTRRQRYILRPLEKLQISRIGSVEISQVQLDDRLDREFKPGLYQQTRAFLDGQNGDLGCTIEQQVCHCGIYDAIAGYGHFDTRRQVQALSE